MDDLERMIELRKQGFFCSQILMIMGLELQGKTNSDLVRSMHSLAGGIGFTGETCGALTASACLIGLYAGKAEPQQAEDPRLMFMVGDLVNWFRQEIASQYGGMRCEEILQGKGMGMGGPCAGIMAACLQKSKELLVENGFDLSGLEL